MSNDTIDVVVGNIEYPLAAGTPEQRAISMDASQRLSTKFDLLKRSLLQRHATIQKMLEGKVLPGKFERLTIYDVPEACIIESIWLFWCYTSHDVQALRKEIDEIDEQLLQRVAELEATVTTLNDTVRSLMRDIAQLKATT